MKRYHLLLLAVASAPLLIHAEPVRTSAAAMDANAAVPQLKYHSAFSEYKPTIETQASPDKVWVRANREVSGEPSDGASENMSMQVNHAPTAQDKPAATPAADPHKGHNMNMKGH
jgi:hypothetical protein